MSAILGTACNKAANLQQRVPVSLNARVKVLHTVETLSTYPKVLKKEVYSSSLEISPVTNYLLKEWERAL